MLPDGRFLSTIGDHRGADGNAYLFVYDPETRRITRVADVLSQVEHEEGAWGYGKIHAQLVASGCDVYLSTYWGSRHGLEFSPHLRRRPAVPGRSEHARAGAARHARAAPRHPVARRLHRRRPALRRGRRPTRLRTSRHRFVLRLRRRGRPGDVRIRRPRPHRLPQHRRRARRHRVPRGRGRASPRLRARERRADRRSRTRCPAAGGSGRRPHPVPTGPSTASPRTRTACSRCIATGASPTWARRAATRRRSPSRPTGAVSSTSRARTATRTSRAHRSSRSTPRPATRPSSPSSTRRPSASWACASAARTTSPSTRPAIVSTSASTPPNRVPRDAFGEVVLAVVHL